MRLADNHDGWEVQALDKLGWFRVAGPYAVKELADKVLKKFVGARPDREHRVAEALCHTKS